LSTVAGATSSTAANRELNPKNNVVMSFIKIGLKIEIRLPLIGLFPKALGLTKFMEKCFKIKKMLEGRCRLSNCKKVCSFWASFFTL
jgi:hypothetical protein